MVSGVDGGFCRAAPLCWGESALLVFSALSLGPSGKKAPEGGSLFFPEEVGSAPVGASLELATRFARPNR